jgi:hypothetical protein
MKFHRSVSWQGWRARSRFYRVGSRTRAIGIQNPFSRGLRKIIESAVVIFFGGTLGCSSISAPTTLTLEQLDSLVKIQSIALMTPNVNVVRQGMTPRSLYERPVSEWTDTARQNIVRAVEKKFAKLFFLEKLEARESVDALLAITASDEIKTSGRRAMDTIGFAYGTFLMPMLYVTVVPMVLVMNPKANVGEFNRNMLKAMWPAGLTTLKMELTNPHSGDILWTFTKESRSGYDLRDPGSVESLIAEAVEDLTRTISQEKNTNG